MLRTVTHLCSIGNRVKGDGGGNEEDENEDDEEKTGSTRRDMMGGRDMNTVR
jgi:hypothetical protein